MRILCCRILYGLFRKESWNKKSAKLLLEKLRKEYQQINVNRRGIGETHNTIYETVLKGREVFLVGDHSITSPAIQSVFKTL